MKRFITLLAVAVLITAACGKTKEPEIKNLGQPEVAIAPEGGSAAVTFTGENDYTCAVYGYSAVDSTAAKEFGAALARTILKVI